MILPPLASRYKLADARELEEGLADDPLLPLYDGPPLQDTKRISSSRARKIDYTPWWFEDWGGGEPGLETLLLKDPSLRAAEKLVGTECVKLLDEGLEYRCYPSSESSISMEDRSADKWFLWPFPLTCAGVECTTKQDLEALFTTLRHYEAVKDQRGDGRLREDIDPRFIDGEKRSTLPT